MRQNCALQENSCLDTLPLTIGLGREIELHPERLRCNKLNTLQKNYPVLQTYVALQILWHAIPTSKRLRTTLMLFNWTGVKRQCSRYKAYYWFRSLHLSYSFNFLSNSFKWYDFLVTSTNVYVQNEGCNLLKKVLTPLFLYYPYWMNTNKGECVNNITLRNQTNRMKLLNYLNACKQ